MMKIDDYEIRSPPPPVTLYDVNRKMKSHPQPVDRVPNLRGLYISSYSFVHSSLCRLGTLSLTHDWKGQVSKHFVP